MVPTEPQSPCIRACTLDTDTDICLGCYRTLAEITAWSSYGPRKNGPYSHTWRNVNARARKYQPLPSPQRRPR